MRTGLRMQGLVVSIGRIHPRAGLRGSRFLRSGREAGRPASGSARVRGQVACGVAVEVGERRPDRARGRVVRRVRGGSRRRRLGRASRSSASSDATARSTSRSAFRSRSADRAATVRRPALHPLDRGVDVGERRPARRDARRHVPGADRVGSEPGRVIRRPAVRSRPARLAALPSNRSANTSRAPITAPNSTHTRRRTATAAARHVAGRIARAPVRHASQRASPRRARTVDRSRSTGRGTVVARRTRRTAHASASVKRIAARATRATRPRRDHEPARAYNSPRGDAAVDRDVDHTVVRTIGNDLGAVAPHVRGRHRLGKHDPVALGTDAEHADGARPRVAPTSQSSKRPCVVPVPEIEPVGDAPPSGVTAKSTTTRATSATSRHRRRTTRRDAHPSSTSATTAPIHAPRVCDSSSAAVAPAAPNPPTTRHAEHAARSNATPSAIGTSNTAAAPTYAGCPNGPPTR